VGEQAGWGSFFTFDREATSIFHMYIEHVTDSQVFGMRKAAFGNVCVCGVEPLPQMDEDERLLCIQSFDRPLALMACRFREFTNSKQRAAHGKRITKLVSVRDNLHRLLLPHFPVRMEG
jgi:hypothetical protein